MFWGIKFRFVAQASHTCFIQEVELEVEEIFFFKSPKKSRFFIYIFFLNAPLITFQNKTKQLSLDSDG